MVLERELQLGRRRRNVFAAIALAGITLSTAVCLPRVVARRNELKSANDQLLFLHARIRDIQAQTGTTQLEILRAQEEIKKELAGNR